jgi:hypothetical protein
MGYVAQAKENKMIKFGLLLGVLVVGVVLIIVGIGGPPEPQKVGGVVPKAAQAEYEASKSTFTWSLVAGIGVSLLSVGGFALMLRSSPKRNDGEGGDAEPTPTPAEDESDE